MQYLFRTIVGVVCLVLITTSVSAQELEIHCINVGRGECTLIISPSGKTMLVDSGPPYLAWKSHLCRYLDSLDVHTVDYALLTHYHYHHIGGIDTLLKNGVVIDTVLDRGWDYCSAYYQETLVPAITDLRRSVVDGEVIDLGAGVNVRVVAVNGNGELAEPFYECLPLAKPLAPHDENNYCIALVVDFGHFQFFVGGDLPGSTTSDYFDIESSVAPEVGDIEVYQVNNHGSVHCTNETFLTTLNPQVSIISAGTNSDGHPDTSVVRRLLETGAVYQTGDASGSVVDGDIVIRTPGVGWFTVNDDEYEIFPSAQPYYHALQNFDDDVDRMKTYANLFGGNFGVAAGLPEIEISYDPLNTRTGFGRSRKIEYGPLTSWSMYVESLNGKWYSSETCFNLTNLFPDYVNAVFVGRTIDSLVFYYKLAAADPLTLKLELHDTANGSSAYTREIFPAAEWQRFAVALHEFSGTCDLSAAKFVGLTFADMVDDQLVNLNESGTLSVDDFYLVENEFSRPTPDNDLDLLMYLNQVSFRHFWMAVDPVSKFAFDRHTWNDLISVDAIGFQLASYAIAHRRRWIDQPLIEARVEHILDYLLHHCEHAADTLQVKSAPLAYATVHGNWAHFLDYQTLQRKDAQTEFSIFTNALLLAGVLTCQSYFDWNENIVQWADTLYRNVDWNFLYMPDNMLMRYAWSPENGYTDAYADWFTEELDLAFLLAISSPDVSHRPPTNPYWSTEYYKPCCGVEGSYYVYSAPGANFTYYFLQMYARFAPDGTDHRFAYTRQALLSDVDFCRLEYASLGYDSRIFGTTACEGPDSAGEAVSNYHAYGYPCLLNSGDEPNGTVAVYGSGAAVPFIPEEAIACLKYYYQDLDSIFLDEYGYGFWSPIFGFPDAFHLAPDQCDDTLVNGLGFCGPWVSVPRFGIDVGPMLLNIDSYISETREEPSIRDLFSGHDYFAGNLAQFGLLCPVGVFEDEETALVPTSELYPNYPNPFNSRTTIEYELPQQLVVRLSIYNIIGRQVRTLVNGLQQAGKKSISWDGTDDTGRSVGSGTYFYRLHIGGRAETRKMVLLK